MSINRRISLLALLAPAMVAAEGPGGGASAAPAAGIVENAPVSAAEVKAFQETLDRYKDRLGEFHQEAQAIVDQREAEERRDLEGGYAVLIDQLDVTNESLREETIRRFESFLSKYPTSEHSPHVMFRLAELYFEQSEEQFLVADQNYQSAMASIDESTTEFPAEPKKDYRRSISLYERIIRDYPDYQFVDGCYYMLGFCHVESSAAAFDEEKAVAYFTELVNRFPTSRFAAQTHMRLGEYYFDYNRLAEAMEHYQKVVDIEGREGNLYDEGLYKLAWSTYKKSDYAAALTLLTELMDWSKQVSIPRFGQPSSAEPEAIEYTAISFSDYSDILGQRPLKVAQDYFARIGGRSYESEIFKRLADVLKQQARYDDAIATYEYLQARWPDDPENPDFQWMVARLHNTKIPPDLPAMQESITRLTEIYNDESNWWRANRANPDALAKARGYIEQSLAQVATSYHAEAEQSKKPADYERAAAMYGQYLTKFPFAVDYYEIEWYRADTLLKAGHLEEAQREYEQLLKAGDHNYKPGALWTLMQIRRQLIIDKFGAFDAVPTNGIVEKQVSLPSGKERLVYQLDDAHKEFIEVCDSLVNADFRPAADKVKADFAAATDPETKARLQSEYDGILAYADALDEYRSALAYLPAQILYFYGHYDEARQRFEAINKGYFTTVEAEYSAKLHVDSFADDEDLANVRKWSEIYSLHPPGPPEELIADKAHFTDLLEASTYKLCEEHIKKGDRAKAAECFLDFNRQFTKSKYRKNALYSVANSYEEIGRADDAIRYFEEYVNTYPDDEKSRPLLFRIATNYASALELPEAVRYFELLYNQTNGAPRPVPYVDAPIALFNAAFLRIGLGDHEGAAKNFERYANENAMGDAEQVMFMAGEQWEAVGDAEALVFYRRYLSKSWASPNSDHVIEAYNRIAVLTERSGKPRDVEKAWKDLSDAFARIAAQGTVGPAGRHYAAHAAFRDLQKSYESFQQIQFTSNDDKNADLLLNVKLAQLNDIDAAASQIVAVYQDFEYSSAALYVMGSSYLTYADMLFRAPPPKGLDDEELMLYTEAIDERRIPVEDKGRARLETNLQKARTEGAWSEWVTRTVDLLAQKFPADFAPEKEEIRGAGESNYVPTAGPISVRSAEKAAEEPPVDQIWSPGAGGTP